MIKQNERNLFYDSNKSKLYLYNNKMHKIFKGLITEALEDQVYYNMIIGDYLDKRIVMPSALIPDESGMITGYIMDYIQGITLSKKILHNDLDFDDKTRIINDLFNLLKQVHEYLTVGDIRNSNIIIGKDHNPYMIDFDFSVRNNSSRVPIASYQLANGIEYINDKNGDMVKMLISSLSLLYDHSVEHDMKNIEDIEFLSTLVPNNGLLRDYYDYLLNKIKHKETAIEYLNIPFSKDIEKEVLIKKRELLK